MPLEAPGPGGDAIDCDPSPSPGRRWQLSSPSRLRSFHQCTTPTELWHEESPSLSPVSSPAPSVSAQQTQTPPAQPPPSPTGYQDTPMQPNGKWHIHDGTRPQPRVVTPGPLVSLAPPSDAIVLLGSGQDLESLADDAGRRSGELADRERRDVERQGDDPHDAGRLHRLPAPRRVRDPVGREGQQPGPRQQRRLPERRLRDPGARQLREHHLSGRPGLGDVRPVPADGQRVAQARRVAVLRHHLHRPAVQRHDAGDGRRS